MLVVDAWSNKGLIDKYDNCIETRGKNGKGVFVLWDDDEVVKEYNRATSKTVSSNIDIDVDKLAEMVGKRISEKVSEALNTI